MSKYRLKKEAVPFIAEKHATRIYELDTWESIGIDIKALEKIEMPYISHGIKTSENSASLGGWSKDEGGRFEFTIHFPSAKYMEYDKFSKGRMIRDLMNRMQDQAKYFFSNFINGEIEE